MLDASATPCSTCIRRVLVEASGLRSFQCIAKASSGKSGNFMCWMNVGRPLGKCQSSCLHIVSLVGSVIHARLPLARVMSRKFWEQGLSFMLRSLRKTFKIIAPIPRTLLGSVQKFWSFGPFLGFWTSSQPFLGLWASSGSFLGLRASSAPFVGSGRLQPLGLFPTFSGSRASSGPFVGPRGLSGPSSSQPFLGLGLFWSFSRSGPLPSLFWASRPFLGLF